MSIKQLLIGIPLAILAALLICFFLQQLFPSLLYAPDAITLLPLAGGIYLLVTGIKGRSSASIILGVFLVTLAISPGILFILALIVISRAGL